MTEDTTKQTVTTIEKAGEHAGKTVTIRGWLYNMRESGKLLFPIFRDGSGIMQGVVSLKESPDAFAALKGLPIESSVIVTGSIREEKRAPGGYEMGVSTAEVVSRVSDDTPYPIQLKEHGVDFLLDKRHLWIRTAAAGGDSKNSRAGGTRGAKLHGSAGLHADRRTDFHARGLRGHFDAVRSELHR